MNFDKCRQAMKDTITMMNVSADHRDKYKNREEYGRLQVFVLFLQDMGHEIDGSIITDEDGMKKVVYMTIDGKRIGQFANTQSTGIFETVMPETKEDESAAVDTAEEE